jgi:lysozyme
MWVIGDTSWRVKVGPLPVVKWTWIYDFTDPGGVRWRDPLNGMTGKGTWKIKGNKLITRWVTSKTWEEWDWPIMDPSNATGKCHMEEGVYDLNAQRLDEDVSNDPYPATEDGEQPQLFSLSDEGLLFLRGHEGCRLGLYNDSAGHCSIGIGHLVHHGPCNGSEPAKFRNRLTEDEVIDLFRNDLQKYESAVSNSVTSRLNQYYYDALVSFAFNIGIGGFQTSGVLKEVNAKRYSKVPGEMMKWLNPPELRGRRTDEAHLFATGIYSYVLQVCK